MATLRFSSDRVVRLNKRLILLSVLTAVTCLYFWTQSRYPALNEKAIMGGETELSALGFDVIMASTPDDALLVQIVANTVNWTYTNKQGMTFGILMAMLLMTILPLARAHLPGGRFASTATGAVLGAPLGVCVNCATPIAQGLHAAGSRIETTLATLFSSPTLNFIVLTMLFALFPLPLALLKLGLTLLFILVMVPLLTRLVPTSRTASLAPVAEIAPTMPVLPGVAVPPLEPGTEESWGAATVGTVRSLVRNLSYIVQTTVPLMILAGFLGSALVTVMPFETLVALVPRTGRLITLAGIGTIATVGLFLPVPMAFDIIVTAVLLEAGLPVHYAMVLLFTLGIFSVYPFAVLWREVSRPLALSITATLVLLGGISGVSGKVVAEWMDAREMQQFLMTFEEQAAALPDLQPSNSNVEPGMPFGRLQPLLHELRLEPVAIGPATSNALPTGISLATVPFAERAGEESLTFARYEGRALGLLEDDEFSPFKTIYPYAFMRGMAAGDVHGDGWVDVIFTSERGLALYANRGGTGFLKQEIEIPRLRDWYVGGVGLVDLNDDGWLDIVFTTLLEGAYVIYSDQGRFSEDALHALPNHEQALNAVTPAFGDLDRDGDLDVVIGNSSYNLYVLGFLTEASRNVLLDNRTAQLGSDANETERFELSLLPDPGGETLATLITDINADDLPDLVIGNDQTASDWFYLGDGRGGLMRVAPEDGVIPHTTSSTMSVATGDIDNDLRAELYIAQLTRHPDADVRRDGRLTCDEYESAKYRAACRSHYDVLTVMAEAWDRKDSRRCTEVEDGSYRSFCIGSVMLRIATRTQRDPSLCTLFPADWSAHVDTCNYSFAQGPMVSKKDPITGIQQIRGRNVLLQMQPDGVFRDVAESLAVEHGGETWAARFGDLDNDGWQDLFVVNGLLGHRLRQERNYLYHNQSGTGFEEIGEQVGLGSFLDTHTYSYIDYDHDGDLDIITVPAIGPLWLYENRSTGGNAIAIELRDERGNHFGIGSKVIIRYGPEGQHHQMREIQAGGGYLSMDAPIAHFGLGEYERVEQVEVVWSTGERTRLETPLAASARYIITRASDD